MIQCHIKMQLRAATADLRSVFSALRACMLFLMPFYWPPPPTLAVTWHGLTSDLEGLLIVGWNVPNRRLWRICCFCVSKIAFNYTFFLKHGFKFFISCVFCWVSLLFSIKPLLHLSLKHRWISYLKRGESFKHSSKSSLTVISPFSCRSHKHTTPYSSGSSRGLEKGQQKLNLLGF